MALLQINHKSTFIQTNLVLNMILPEVTEEDPRPVRERKVLWLLHGLGGDGSTWVRNGNAERVAQTYGITMIMPSVGRSFYADMDNGQRYFSYLTEELPKWIGERFNLDLSRENSMIAGLSMGGYGAFLAALRRPDLYSEAASFSGLLATEILHGPQSKTVDPVFMKEMSMIFGGLEKVPGSVYDPGFLLQQMAKEPEKYPHLYASIGRDDDLLPTNRIFAQRAQALGLPLTYIEDEGDHTWAFWQKYLPIWLNFVLGEHPGEKRSAAF